MPAKLARKLNAFLIIRWARTLGGIVVVGEAAGREGVRVEDGDFVCSVGVEVKAESCAATVVASSIEMPTVISGCVVPPMPAAAADTSSTMTSSSSITAAPQVGFGTGSEEGCGDRILKIALCLSLLSAPRS